jgi:GT2 family glycosyltransferase
MKPPSLSVVIPSYRRADLLELCLRSVVRYAPPEAEILVVDDGSEGEVVSRKASEFPRVRCLRLARRSNFCVAANRGIEATTGEIVELLNDDTQVQENWFNAPLRAFENPLVGAVAPLVLQGPVTEAVPRIDSAGDEYDRGGFAWKRGHGRRLCDAFQRRRFVFGASASSAFYRRSALNRVGHFPEEFGAYFEDVDLSFRLRQAGYSILFEPESRVWHRCGSSYSKHNRKLIEMQSRNEERVFWRNRPLGEVIRSLPRHFGVLAGKTLLRMREGTLLPFLLGRLRVLGEVRELLRHRADFRLRTGPQSFDG